MGFPRRKPPSTQITKYRYACHVAAGLAFVLIRQQDPVGLVMFNDQITEHLPPLRTMGHLRHLVEAMDRVRPVDRTNSSRALHAAVDLIKRRGLVILISDLMDDSDKISQGLAHLRQRGHDVIVIQVLDEAELNFPFDQTITFRDLESADHITVNTADIAADYALQFTEFLDKYKRACYEHGFDYVLASTATPYDTLLTALLSRRQR